MTMPIDRRLFLTGAAAMTAAPAGAALSPSATDDTAFWKAVAAQYAPTRAMIPLENGNWA